ncbi:hypothetical protein RYH80_11685 [Halobaculum sp. MBLA0147]|uniref:hypothetical protein n=1 Tax=Halobaculum sp. MBLA0147 TaxID=3079934 RepID=UPI0035241046
MMTIQFLTVLLTILIAIVPLWYPRYSLYRRNADSGIRKLERFEIEQISEQNSGSVDKEASLSPGDTGFREVSEAIEKNTSIVREPSEIVLAIEGSLGTARVGPGTGLSSGLNAEIRVEYADGTQDVVVPSPEVELRRVTNLVDLKNWVRSESIRRSHYWTTVLAIAWGTASVASIL